MLQNFNAQKLRKVWSEDDKQSCWDDPNRRAMTALQWHKLLARDIKQIILQLEQRRELKNDVLKLLSDIEDTIMWSEYDDADVHQKVYAIGDDWVDTCVCNLMQKVRD
jgi:hypothetical protein